MNDHKDFVVPSFQCKLVDFKNAASYCIDVFSFDWHVMNIQVFEHELKLAMDGLEFPPVVRVRTQKFATSESLVVFLSVEESFKS